MTQYIELKLKTDLYSEPDKKGKQKILKRNIPTRIFVHREDIKSVGEVYNKKGKVLTKECKIHILDIGPLIVSHSYEYIKQLKEEEEQKNTKIGF